MIIYKNIVKPMASCTESCNDLLNNIILNGTVPVLIHTGRNITPNMPINISLIILGINFVKWVFCC